MEETFGSYARDLKKEISEYVELRLEYTKLVTYEKTSRVAAAGVSFLLLGFFAFFTFFFLSFAGGYYLGKVTGSTATGFVIITGVYLILLLLVVFLRKKYLEKFIVEKMIDVLMDEDKDDDEKN